jgi:hypothetical protein
MMYQLIHQLEVYEFQSGVPIVVGDIIERPSILGIEKFKVVERKLVMDKRCIQYVDLHCEEA